MHFDHETFEAPIGSAVAIASPAGLVALRFAEDETRLGPVLDAQLRLLDALPASAPRRTDDSLAPAGDDTPPQDETAPRTHLESVARELHEYFAGTRRSFDVPLDLRMTNGIARRALDAIGTIPYAETASYGEVAALAGSPRAARAVGTACATTPISVVVPVHRVVRADGSIGEYGGRPDVKRFLLDLEARAARSTGG